MGVRGCKEGCKVANYKEALEYRCRIQLFLEAVGEINQ